MKSFPVSLIAVLLFVFGARQAVGAPQDMNVEFPNEGLPGVLKVFSGEGDVTITGYNGNVVVITTEESDEKVMKSGKAKGLKRISGNRFNVSTDSDENAVIITRSFGEKVDLDIKVPRNTSLDFGSSVGRNATGPLNPLPILRLKKRFFSFWGEDYIELRPDSRFGAIFNGNVTVKNTTGDMEISTVGGNITLSDVSGSAIIYSLDGVVKAVFSGFSGDKPMAISTVDGDVDVTLPSNIKATIAVSNLDNDVFTDFDVDMVREVGKNDSDWLAVPVVPTPPNVEPPSGQPGESDGEQIKNNIRFRGFPGKSLYGKINGGGTEIRIQTLGGDVFIRKGE